MKIRTMTMTGYGGPLTPAPSAAHSPEPWRALATYSPEANGPDQYSPYIIDATGRNVAAAMMIPECEGEFLSNRARIVACVNACAGIPAALLTGAGSVAPAITVTQLQTGLADLRAENAQLREVLHQYDAALRHVGLAYAAICAADKERERALAGGA